MATQTKAKPEEDKILNLTGDKPERPKVIMPDGSSVEMRTAGELNRGQLRRIEEINQAVNGKEGSKIGFEESEKLTDEMLEIILVQPTREQLDGLNQVLMEKIMDFFSSHAQAPPKLTNGRLPPSKRKGSSGGKSKRG